MGLEKCCMMRPAFYHIYETIKCVELAKYCIVLYINRLHDTHSTLEYYTVSTLLWYV